MNSTSAEQVLEEIARLAEQLGSTLDNSFNGHLSSGLDDPRLVKLVTVINALIERASDNASHRLANDSNGFAPSDFGNPPAARSKPSRNPGIEAHVLQALEEGRVVAWFQPIVSARIRSIAGFEALVRIHQADGTLLNPADFIPLVEGSDLIGPLTETVVNQSLAQLAQWRADGLVSPECFMAVNLSSKHMLSNNLNDLISRALLNHGIPAQNLKLEVTETALVENVDTAIEQLHSLRKLGCKIAVDDFGTGYSSLEYLQRLPLDVLKLDRAFVREVEISRKPLAIARTVCDLARLLDLQVVAEGVETISQSELLESLGVGLLQGYWFRTPAPGTEMTQWLASDEAHSFERIIR